MALQARHASDKYREAGAGTRAHSDLLHSCTDRGEQSKEQPAEHPASAHLPSIPAAELTAVSTSPACQLWLPAARRASVGGGVLPGFAPAAATDWGGDCANANAPLCLPPAEPPGLRVRVRGSGTLRLGERRI